MGWGLGFDARAVSHQHALQRAPELRQAQVEDGLEKPATHLKGSAEQAASFASIVSTQLLEVLTHEELEVPAEFLAMHRAIPVVQLLQEAPHPLRNKVSHIESKIPPAPPRAASGCDLLRGARRTTRRSFFDASP